MSGMSMSLDASGISFLQCSPLMTVFAPAGMNQQGDPSSFMAQGSSPPTGMMQGRMGGPPQSNMMPGNPQGGPMYPSADMKGWPQGGMQRNRYVARHHFSSSSTLAVNNSQFP